MIILKNVSNAFPDFTYRPGELNPASIIPNYAGMFPFCTLIILYDHKEFYIVKARWTRERVYGNIEELDKLVAFYIAREINP